MIAILLMGGKGERFGNDIPKQFSLLMGQPLYTYALDIFLSVNLFDKILLVIPTEYKDTIDIKNSRVQCITGGKTRQESVYNALQASPTNTDFVVIHDIARPFVSKKIILDNIEAVQQHAAVDTCYPATDTIVQSLDEKFIHSVLIRNEMYLGQTPQSFSYSLLLKAHQKAQKEGILNATDDCQLVQRLDFPIFMVLGSKDNFKITEHKDLDYAQFLLEKNIHGTAK